MSKDTESFPSISFPLNHQKWKLIGAKSWMDSHWAGCFQHFGKCIALPIRHILRRVQERMYNTVSNNGSIRSKHWAPIYSALESNRMYIAEINCGGRYMKIYSLIFLCWTSRM